MARDSSSSSSGNIGSDSETAGEELIELPARLKDWIAKKARGYHARKTSSKTTAQYRAGLEYIAFERLEIAVQNGIAPDRAEEIVFQALGKSSAHFHGLVVQAIREKTILINAARETEKARADAQEPLIRQLQESQEQMRAFGSMIERMMERVEHIAQLQITSDVKKNDDGR